MSHPSSPPVQISASQIERIVRDVLASLASESTAGIIPSAKQTSAPAKTIPATLAIPPAPAPQPTVAPVDRGAPVNRGAPVDLGESVHLGVPVLSLDALRALPKDTKQITILSNTLITPAAKDFLREKGIACARGGKVQSSQSDRTNESTPSTEQKNNASPAKRLLVTGSVLWLRNLENQLCPKATLIDQVQMDDAAAVRSVAQAIRNGASSAIAIVKAPHATLWQAARDEALRPAIISQWSDLVEVLREVPTNLLIVPATRWNIAGSANIARKFLEFINTNR